MMHERIAVLLGWSVDDARSLSLRALRDLVRGVPASKARDELLREINACESTGRVVKRRDEP